MGQLGGRHHQNNKRSADEFEKNERETYGAVKV